MRVDGYILYFAASIFIFLFFFKNAATASNHPPFSFAFNVQIVANYETYYYYFGLGSPGIDPGVTSTATDPTGAEYEQQPPPSAFPGRQRTESVDAAGRFVDTVPSFQTLCSDPVVQRPGPVGCSGPEPVGRDQDQH